MDKIDYASLAKSRYTSVFAKDPVFDAIIQTIIEYKMKTQDLYINFADTILDIDKSTGNNLDLIGSIVGQPRVLVDFSIDKYFGFLGNPRAEPYDVGLWYSTFSNKGSDTRTLSDEEYRRIIKARIIRNKTNCNRQDFIDILDLILGIDRGPYAPNILENSDFKDGYFVNGGDTVEIYKDPNLSPYDLIKVTSGNTSGAPNTLYIHNVVETLSVKKGKTYTLSMKASCSTGKLMSSIVINFPSTYQSIFSDVPVSSDRTKPTNMTVTFVAEQDIDHAVFLMGIGEAFKDDWFEISELKIMEGEVPPSSDVMYTLTSKSHGNIDLNVYNYKGDLGVHFLSNFDKTGDLIPKPLGYKLSIMMH